jgi:6-phosphogluconolactonase
MVGMARLVALALFVVGCGGGGETGGDAGHFVGGGDAGANDATGNGDAPAEGTAPNDAGHEAAGEAGAGETGAPAKLVAYASGYGPDIQWLSVNASSGALAGAGSIASFGTAPSFLAVDGATKHLYAVDEATPGQVGSYAIDASSGALTFQNAVSSGGDGPPYVTVDPHGWVLVANYSSGSVAVLPVKADGSLGAAVDTQSPGKLAHMIVPDPSGHFVFVPCLGSDYVAQYLFDSSTGKLTPNAVPHLGTAAGAGPRHLEFHPGGKVAYLVDETASTMTALAFDSTAGTLSAVQTISTLPSGFTGTNTAAEVHVHPSGRWLFASNRGDDSIAVFSLDASGKMTVQGFTKSGGTTPRDFALDPTGTFLYAANQGTGNVVAFRFDATAGTLTPTGNTVPVAAASFVGLFPLP